MQKTSIFRGKPITTLYFDPHQDSMEQIDHNEPEVKDRHWHIKPGAIVLDIGAAMGAYTLTAISQGAEKVIAWEPTMPNFLIKNLEVNGWQDKCVVIKQAMWSKPGYIKSAMQRSVVPEYAETISSTDYLCNAEPGLSQPVCYIECNTLDNSIAMNEPHIDIIKIDVECAELEVLKGGEQLLRKFKPDVLIENHTFLDANIYENCKNFMLQLGYTEVLTVPYFSVSHSFYSMQEAQKQTDVKEVGMKTDAECVAPWMNTGNGKQWPPLAVNPICNECGGYQFIELGGADAASAYHPNLDIRAMPGVDNVFDFETQRIPYHDSHAERIKMEHVINHLKGITAKNILKECLRVLKPGGTLYIMVTDIEFVCKRILEDGLRECWGTCIWGTVGNTYDADFHYYGYTQDSLKQLLLDTGFTTVVYDGNPNGWEFRMHAVK